MIQGRELIEKIDEAIDQVKLRFGEPKFLKMNEQTLKDVEKFVFDNGWRKETEHQAEITYYGLKVRLDESIPVGQIRVCMEREDYDY